jgi:hypothetical protein
VFIKRVAVQVSRPVDAVFASVEDARNRPQSDESVDSEELTSPEPIGVGTTVRTTLSSMGREYEYTWDVNPSAAWRPAPRAIVAFPRSAP